MFPSLTSVTIEIETRAVMRPRRISILGATGSIGESTLDLIGRMGGMQYTRTTERFEMARPKVE